MLSMSESHGQARGAWKLRKKQGSGSKLGPVDRVWEEVNGEGGGLGNKKGGNHQFLVCFSDLKVSSCAAITSCMDFQETSSIQNPFLSAI